MVISPVRTSPVHFSQSPLREVGNVVMGVGLGGGIVWGLSSYGPEAVASGNEGLKVGTTFVSTVLTWLTTKCMSFAPSDPDPSDGSENS